MKTLLITGGGGLVGSHCAQAALQKSWSIVLIDNNNRASFFGKNASTKEELKKLGKMPHTQILEGDIQDPEAIKKAFALCDKRRPNAIIHAAGQPSHDWAGNNPATDFEINAVGTLKLLETWRANAPEAPLAFLSSNKVYGDRPNKLNLKEKDTRWDLSRDDPYWIGVDENMPIDQSLHSPFGVSKCAADLLVQEYGKYYGLPGACFRCGCITGKNQKGTRLHGFLAYLAQCSVTGTPYKIEGYAGKQVRDNLHAQDLAQAIHCFIQDPKENGAVYNMGGGRENSCSIQEAITMLEEATGRALTVSKDPKQRKGDHKWWITNTKKFERDYPKWNREKRLEGIVEELSKKVGEIVKER